MASLRSNNKCSFAWRRWAVDRSNEAIPTPSECLNEYRSVSRIALPLHWTEYDDFMRYLTLRGVTRQPRLRMCSTPQKSAA
jgi:hypothetical protein